MNDFIEKGVIEIILSNDMIAISSHTFVLYLLLSLGIEEQKQKNLAK
jgi:hypothetical protein